MAARSRSISLNRKKKSGRRTAADALLATKCTRCSSRSETATMAIQTTRGTKWITYCPNCRDWAMGRKERGAALWRSTRR